jgi:biofilm PGA synthesis N-glycosyltransferase PgaC
MQWIFLIAVLPYFFLLLTIFIDIRKIKKSSFGGWSDLPVTVVIACRNESANIDPLLSGLQSQDLPENRFRCIFTDDNSSDDTPGRIRDFINENGLRNMKVIRSSGHGKKTAVSEGVSAAATDLIVTTDADCRMGSRWLGTISDFQALNNADMIVCPVSLGDAGGFFGKFQQLEFLSLQGITAGTLAGNRPVMCNGANLAFRKEAFLRNRKNLQPGLQSGDDIFLLHSLKKEGSPVKWLESSEALVTAKPAADVASFLRQRKRWISKSRSYKDSYTITLGIVTFVTILSELTTLLAGFFNTAFWLVWLTIFVVKSIPDYLIIKNTASRYGMQQLMRWFIPSQALYPFYVTAVLLYPGSDWK